MLLTPAVFVRMKNRMIHPAGSFFLVMDLEHGDRILLSETFTQVLKKLTIHNGLN